MPTSVKTAEPFEGTMQEGTNDAYCVQTHNDQGNVSGEELDMPSIVELRSSEEESLDEEQQGVMNTLQNTSNPEIETNMPTSVKTVESFVSTMREEINDQGNVSDEQFDMLSKADLRGSGEESFDEEEQGVTSTSQNTSNLECHHIASHLPQASSTSVASTGDVDKIPTDRRNRDQVLILRQVMKNLFSVWPRHIGILERNSILERFNIVRDLFFIPTESPDRVNTVAPGSQRDSYSAYEGMNGYIPAEPFKVSTETQDREDTLAPDLPRDSYSAYGERNDYIPADPFKISTETQDREDTLAPNSPRDSYSVQYNRPVPPAKEDDGDLNLTEERGYKPKVKLPKENKKEPSRLPKDVLCKVCSRKECNIVFLPCKHLCSCDRCFTIVKLCLICKTPVEDILKVYRS